MPTTPTTFSKLSWLLLISVMSVAVTPPLFAGALPTPSPTNTPTGNPLPTRSPTPTPTASPTATPSVTPTHTPTSGSESTIQNQTIRFYTGNGALRISRSMKNGMVHTMALIGGSRLTRTRSSSVSSMKSRIEYTFAGSCGSWASRSRTRPISSPKCRESGAIRSALTTPARR